MQSRVDDAFPEGYSRSDQDTEFHYDTGVIAVPTAGAEPGHKLIRLHGGIGRRVVNWDVRRRGNPPIVPTMSDTTGDTFLGGSIMPSLPVPTRDAQGRGYDWKVKGRYEYVQDDPRVVGTDAIPVGQHPFFYPAAATAAAQLVGSSGFAAYQTDGFAGFVGVAEANLELQDDGTYLWPVLALPATFTSTHIVQD